MEPAQAFQPSTLPMTALSYGKDTFNSALAYCPDSVANVTRAVLNFFISCAYTLGSFSLSLLARGVELLKALNDAADTSFKNHPLLYLTCALVSVTILMIIYLYLPSSKKTFPVPCKDYIDALQAAQKADPPFIHTDLVNEEARAANTKALDEFTLFLTQLIKECGAEVVELDEKATIITDTMVNMLRVRMEIFPSKTLRFLERINSIPLNKAPLLIQNGLVFHILKEGGCDEETLYTAMELYIESTVRWDKGPLRWDDGTVKLDPNKEAVNSLQEHFKISLTSFSRAPTEDPLSMSLIQQNSEWERQQEKAEERARLILDANQNNQEALHQVITKRYKRAQNILVAKATKAKKENPAQYIQALDKATLHFSRQLMYANEERSTSGVLSEAELHADTNTPREPPREVYQVINHTTWTGLLDLIRAEGEQYLTGLEPQINEIYRAQDPLTAHQAKNIVRILRARASWLDADDNVNDNDNDAVAQITILIVTEWAATKEIAGSEPRGFL